jgi:methyl-accepting chemotaxis protein
MLKNMKLASKLYLGFGIVVVIAAVLAYVGWSSLGKVGHKVAIGDEANRFVKVIGTARLAEKNFIMRGDKKYAQEMLDQKEQFDTLVEEITAQMKVAADKQLIREMHTEAGKYIDQGKQYVELQGKIDELIAVSGPIVQSARNTMKLADDMSSDQEKKLAAVMDVQANIADGSRAHLNWAGDVKDFLADKTATLNVETDGRKCGFGKWLDSSEFAEHAAYCGQEFMTLIAGAREKHLELHKSAVDIAAARKGTTDTSLEVYQQKTAPILEFILGEFAKAEEILKTKVAQRLANANDAKRINEFLLATRQQEKNYLLRNTDEYITKTNEQADNAIALANNLKARFNQQVNKDQAQVAIDACLTYKKAFADVVKYKGEQKVCETDMVAAARKVTEEATNLRQAKKEEMESVAARSNFIMITLAICSIILGAVLAFVITRGIIKPFQNMFKGLKAFSAHELEETTETFKRVIGGLNNGSDQVASASGQVSSASQSLAEGSTEQAAGLEETSSSLEEMSSMTKQNADNAQQANTLASEARKAADTGTEAMKRMSIAISDIQKSSDETAKIIKVIDEIAFQTNLLALNAAVEAARAGEAGKGFAVVAEEVRNLAMRSAEAAKNTTAMIDESVKNSKNGVDIATEVAKVLEEMVQGIGKTTDLVGEIAAASQEQAQGIDQINTAMAQMDKVTQQNAANAEESASASEELNAQAESMNQIVEELIVMVEGSDGNKRQKKDLGRHLNTNVNHGAAQKAHGLNKSDHAFHKIANNKAQEQQTARPTARTSAPEKAIPLKGDENTGTDDFKEFNG